MTLQYACLGQQGPHANAEEQYTDYVCNRVTGFSDKVFQLFRKDLHSYCWLSEVSVQPQGQGTSSNSDPSEQQCTTTSNSDPSERQQAGYDLDPSERQGNTSNSDPKEHQEVGYGLDPSERQGTSSNPSERNTYTKLVVLTNCFRFVYYDG